MFSLVVINFVFCCSLVFIVFLLALLFICFLWFSVVFSSFFLLVFYFKMKLILIIELSYILDKFRNLCFRDTMNLVVPETFLFKGGCGGSAVFLFRI